MAARPRAPLDLEAPIRAIGTDLAARMPRPRAVSTARVERRMTDLLVKDPALRAALFRFVDVRPACSTPEDVTRHLHELLADAQVSQHARRASNLTGRPLAARPVAAIAGAGVKQMAQRFIVGEDAQATRCRRSRSCGSRASRRPSTCSARRPSPRPRPTATCSAARRRCARSPPPRPSPARSTSPSRSPRSRRCCVPRRPSAGSRARDRACSTCCASPTTSAPTCTSTWSPSTRARRSPALTLDLLSQPEFAEGPSAGIVLQAYLVDSPEYLEELLDWARETPAQAPVHDPPGQGRLLGPRGRPGRPERLGAAGVHRPPRVRPQLRVAHQAPDRRHADRQGRDRLPQPALDRRTPPPTRTPASVGNDDLEFQILRGLGDDTQAAIAATGRRVRAYCPVGDLVAGMAYLVRRLLENTANDSFLAAHASGTDTAELLEAP